MPKVSQSGWRRASLVAAVRRTHVLLVPRGEKDLEDLNDELVVFELGEARDRDGPDTAGVTQQDRESAAVGGVVRWV